MKQNLIALLCGVIFGIGLSLSHMINPNKVLNFLDISGNWDPSLIFVMAGALAVAFVSFKLILKHSAPVLADSFHVFGKSSVNKPLIIGAATFGIGWGMTGYCPGPAVSSLGLFSVESVFIVVAIYLGFFVCNRMFEQK
ncbi:MAG: YeeE/YedE family protein [Methylococcales bacterium]|nr:YeeE/YedE family protein [Methylococcales bacterium]